MTARTTAGRADLLLGLWGKTGLAAAALGLALASSAHAADFTNGSFESPGGDNIKVQLAEGSTFVTGWTSHGAGTYYESNGQDGINAADGVNWLGFGQSGAHGASITQSFSTVLGASYTLNYQFRLQQGQDEGSAFRFSTSNGASVDSGAATLAGWASGPALSFLGTGGDITLTVLDITPANSGAFSNLALDDLRLTSDAAPTPGVPEPAAWAMMLLGFGGVGALLRSRKRVAA